LQEVDCPCAFALDKAGSSIAAKMAITAMTTSNSTNVNAIPPGNPRPCQREFARLPASFPFMAVGYVNPVAAICRWCAILPNVELS